MPSRALWSARALPGLLIALLGTMLLLGNLGVLRTAGWKQFWPLLLIAFGLHNLFQPGQRVAGALLTGIGAAFQLQALGWIHISFHHYWRYWPVLLIAVGVSLLFRGGRRGDRIGAFVLLGLGGYFLASNFGWLGFDWWRLWPVAIIVAGIMLARGAIGR